MLNEWPQNRCPRRESPRIQCIRWCQALLIFFGGMLSFYTTLIPSSDDVLSAIRNPLTSIYFRMLPSQRSPLLGMSESDVHHLSSEDIAHLVWHQINHSANIFSLTQDMGVPPYRRALRNMTDLEETARAIKYESDGDASMHLATRLREFCPELTHMTRKLGHLSISIIRAYSTNDRVSGELASALQILETLREKPRLLETTPPKSFFLQRRHLAQEIDRLLISSGPTLLGELRVNFVEWLPALEEIQPWVESIALAMEDIVSAIDSEKDRIGEVWKSISWFDYYILSVWISTTQTHWAHTYVELLSAAERKLQPFVENVRAIRGNLALLIAYIKWYDVSTDVMLSYMKPPGSRSMEGELDAAAKELDRLWDDAMATYKVFMMPSVHHPFYAPRLHHVPELLESVDSSSPASYT